MAVITALAPQRRHPDRVSLFVDGRFVVGLSADVAASLGLVVGADVSAEDVETTVRAAELDRAVHRALLYLRARPRSRREFERRLARYGYEPPVVEAVVAMLAERRLCDDAAFARAWIRDRLALKPKGRRALRAELAARGVAAEDVEAALRDEFTEAEEELARRAAEARRDAFRARGEKRGRAALLAFLARRGFSAAIAGRLADEIFH